MCGFQLPQSTKLSRQDFYIEFLRILEYYNIDTVRISSIEEQRLKLYRGDRKKWLDNLWSKHYTLMYEWHDQNMTKHPRKTLQWSQVKAIYSSYLELDLRLNLNRKIANLVNDSGSRQRAKLFQSTLRELAQSFHKQGIHKELIFENDDYKISSRNVNRFIMLYARAYAVNLASTVLINSMRLAAKTFKHNFPLRVPTFEKYRKVYKQEVFTRLAPFYLEGQLERSLVENNLNKSTFVIFDGKRIQSRKSMQMSKSVRSKLLRTLLPDGVAFRTEDLISNLQNMKTPLKALLDHRKKLSQEWHKVHNLTEMKKTEDRLIDLLTKTEESN